MLNHSCWYKIFSLKDKRSQEPLQSCKHTFEGDELLQGKKKRCTLLLGSKHNLKTCVPSRLKRRTHKQAEIFHAKRSVTNLVLQIGDAL